MNTVTKNRDTEPKEIRLKRALTFIKIEKQKKLGVEFF